MLNVKRIRTPYEETLAEVLAREGNWPRLHWELADGDGTQEEIVIDGKVVFSRDSNHGNPREAWEVVEQTLIALGMEYQVEKIVNWPEDEKEEPEELEYSFVVMDYCVGCDGLRIVVGDNCSYAVCDYGYFDKDKKNTHKECPEDMDYML